MEIMKVNTPYALREDAQSKERRAGFMPVAPLAFYGVGQMSIEALNNRQRLFVEAYLKTWNATKAARMAGYAKDSASVQGFRLLRNEKIQAAIRARVTEIAMGTDEVLIRLAQHARASFGDFIDPDSLSIDLRKAAKAKRLHLIKKFEVTTITRDDTQIETVKLELYDAQAALVHLGKHHGLFKDRVQIDDWRSEAVDLIRRGELAYEAVEQELGYDLAQELFAAAGIRVAHAGEAAPGAESQRK